VILVSDNPRALERAAEALERDMRSVPGIGNAAATSGLRRPEIAIQPDSGRAADLGVTVSDVATTVRVATIGDVSTQLPKFNLEDRSIPIRTQLALAAREDLEQLKLLPVPTADGRSVPLDTVARLEIGSGPAPITRFDRRRSVSIKADVAGAPLGAVTAAVQQLPAIQQLPAEVKQTQYGDSERMNELFSEFSIAIVAGVLLVYCVLVLLFHDFAQPMTIMAAMGAGMLPIALRIGADADFRAPMAIAVIGGLVTSTLLSLFYVPIVFTYVDDFTRWVKRALVRPQAEQAAAATSSAA
jgi:multidrug efflux pump subunit AcrB